MFVLLFCFVNLYFVQFIEKGKLKDISLKCDGTHTEDTRNPTFIYTDWDLGLRLVF